MARRRTRATEALFLRQRVEAVERRMSALEAAYRTVRQSAQDGQLDRKVTGGRFDRKRQSAGDGRPERPSDWAEVLATQLVLSGHSRAWVSAYLQETLGVEDPDAILDTISTTSG